MRPWIRALPVAAIALGASGTRDTVRQDLRGTEVAGAPSCEEAPRPRGRGGPPEVTDVVQEEPTPCSGVEARSCRALPTAGQPPPDAVWKAAVAGVRLVILADGRKGRRGAHVYHPGADRWSLADDHPVLDHDGGGGPVALLTRGERLVVVSGRDAGLIAELDPATGTWTSLGSRPPVQGASRIHLLGDWLVFAPSRGVARQTGAAERLGTDRIVAIPQPDPVRTAPPGP